jgi:uncharacterized membrane protein YgdD (TMEM256/DUF423 family)
VQIYNGLGLMLISMHPRFAAHRFAGPAIAAGGAIFSGSIFALVMARDRYGFSLPTWLFLNAGLIVGYVDSNG